MFISTLLSDGECIGRHPDESTWRFVHEGRRLIAKIVARVDDIEPSLPVIDGVPPWLEFYVPTIAEVARLDLDTSVSWVVALRAEIPGITLDDASSLDTRDTALRLAQRVRDLHEVGIVHGDLQPRNIIVHDDDIWVIDVRLFATLPDESGHVAGSAPLMAPELWEGAPPSLSSDRYALATLVVWLTTGHYPLHADTLSGWAIAHRGKTPDADVTDPLGARAAGVLRRMLSGAPEERPEVQALIDALASDSVTPRPTRVVSGIDPHYESVLEAVDALSGAGVVHELACSNRLERRLVIDRVTRLLEWSGKHVFELPARESDATPWQPVLDLAAQIAGIDTTFEVTSGDQLHVFEALTDHVFGAIADRSATLVLDGADLASPDLRAWWRYATQRAARDGLDLSFFEGRYQGQASNSLVPIDASAWNHWRTTTLRAEVRDIATRRWKQLVEEHGQWVTTMSAALDHELGVSTTLARPDRRDAFDTASLVALGKAWKIRVDALLGHCAFGEAASICEAIYDAISVRETPLMGTPNPLEVLEKWTDAIIRGARGEANEKLAGVLRQTAVNSPQAAVCYARLTHALGRPNDGLVALLPMVARLKDTRDADDRRWLADIQGWRAQSLLSLGKFDDAADAARQGLATLAELAESYPHVAAQLALMADGPDSIRGKEPAIQALTDLAGSLEGQPDTAMIRARCHAYRGMGLSRQGAFDEATDAYLRALEEIETAGLDGELPTYLLNVGTAYHRQGRLGLAREYYARGTRVAQATTRASTRALLLANQANVDHALGRLDEATSLIDRALELAEAHDLTNVAINCRSLRADVLLARGQHEDAINLYRETLNDPNVSPFQGTEMHLACAEARLVQHRPDDAHSALDEARRLIEEHKLSDLEHHHGMLRARLQWAEGGNLGTMAGIELFRRALIGAQSTGNHKLVLRQSPHLVAELEREGLSDLLDEVSGIVQDSRNAIAMGLTRELRRDFFANLPALATRAETPHQPTVQPAPAPVAANNEVVERFYRMLSLNELILRGDRLDALLPTALEIALSLCGAERGFVLLKDEARSRVGEFRVAASRDVDGASIPQPHLKVSLTIAEEAARTGRTVVTLNARDDSRFNAAPSVVDLDLTSVLCVPVRDATGLLGALYVDTRFRPGTFAGEIPRMLEAFGHQLALAITNARRINELDRERRELEATQDRLNALLEERELMLRGLEDRVSELTDQVERQQGSLRETFTQIAFASRAMERVLSQVERVARGDIPVVITGESGVGKELIARAVHDSSPRRSGPFVAFNCGAVSETLFESELFGHVKGAFTGANVDRHGLFVSAEGGTIFLDEIGEMPLSMQVKLLRVLQERHVRPVGSTASVPIDVRVVAATHRDLGQMVDEGTFREDLYYRIAALVLPVPPLRDRREDIPLIATRILANIQKESGVASRITPEAARLLTQCEWRGNVRELENALRAASVLSEHDTIDVADLAPLVRVRTLSGEAITATPKTDTRGRRRKASREDVVEAMRQTNDDREAAARLLGVSERTLYRYLKRWDLY